MGSADSPLTRTMGNATLSKPVAWNGVRFDAPCDWEITELGQRHLLLETNDHPIMEVKWGPVKGTFSHRKQLRRLVRGKTQPSSPAVNMAECPPSWTEALGDFEISCFTWQGRSINGTGLILYCPQCRQASLLQFFHTDEQWDSTWTDSVLKSFADHAPGLEQEWSIFDIRFVIPVQFHLTQHRFEPGMYQIGFQTSHQTLNIYRWGLAAVLLNDGDLPAFAQQMKLLDPMSALPTGSSRPEMAQWSWQTSQGRWSRVWQRLLRAHRFQMLRLWHLEATNRILGVHLASRRAIDIPNFESICTAYEIS